MKEVDEFQFLGVTVHKNFRFKSHYNKVLAKLKKGLNALISSKKYLTYNAKLQIYHSLFHSHLLYCSLIWLPKISKTQLNCLFGLQKKALRAVFNTRFNSHTNVLFQMSKVVKVTDICKKESLKFMYQFKENKLPVAISNIIKKHTSIQKSVTRSQKSSTNLTIRGLRNGDTLFDIITHWNESDIEIKENTYEHKSVNQRINHYLRKSYSTCEKSSCFNCFRTKDTHILEQYMLS